MYEVRRTVRCRSVSRSAAMNSGSAPLLPATGVAIEEPYATAGPSLVGAPFIRDACAIVLTAQALHVLYVLHKRRCGRRFTRRRPHLDGYDARTETKARSMPRVTATP